MKQAKVGDHELPLQVLTWLVVIAALYLGRDLLMPFAMSLLITFLLYPVVVRLRRLGIPHVVAVSVTVLVAGVATLGIAVLVMMQLVDLTSKLPDYRDNLRQKVRDVRLSGAGRFDDVTKTLDELNTELSGTAPASRPSTGPATSGAATAPERSSAGSSSLGGGAADPKTDGQSPGQDPDRPESARQADIAVEPIRVTVVNEGPGWGRLAAEWAAPLLVPLAFAAATGLLVTFLLMYCDDLRERIITWAGRRQVGLSTTAIDEASTRIGGFLRMQAVVNGVYGVIVVAMLMSFGIPNALLWGVLASLMRFVPYIGPWVGAAAPVLLTLAVSPDWTTPLLVAGSFAVIEFITNMVLEPWLYGNSTGITSLGIVIAAAFWGWIWGPVGMILAVPMMACLIVVARHVPRLRWLYLLFGSDTEISQVGKFYQRLLVGDREAVRHSLAAWMLTGGGSVGGPTGATTPAKPPRAADESAMGGGAMLAAACDSLVFPTLSELKRDAASGVVSDEIVSRSLVTLETLCGAGTLANRASARLLCVAVEEEIDACAAEVVARAAELEGISALPVSADALAGEVAALAESSGASWIALVRIHPGSETHGRRLLRALSGKLSSGQKVLYCTFGANRRTTPAGEPAESTSTQVFDTDATPENVDVNQFVSMTKLISYLAELNFAANSWRKSAVNGSVLEDPPALIRT